jgi:hypothetical protein
MRWYKQSIFSGVEGQLETLSHADEIGDGLSGHLAHHVAAVHFHCDFAGAEVFRDLLVEAARYDTRHDLAFAPSERRKPFAHLRQDVFPGASLAIVIERPLHGLDQLLLAEGLGQELARA